MKKGLLISITTFVLLLISVGVGVYLVKQHQTGRSNASVEEQPKEIKITNISDNSFSVSWLTDKATAGFIVYGETDKLGLTASDDRDSTGQTARFTHHATVKNLNPTTVYYFKIGSGSSAYDNAGVSYNITTAPTTNDPPAVADPAFGKVVNGQGAPVADALVYLTVAGGTPLSSYTRADGNWLITLNNARRADLSTYITYKPTGDSVTFFVQAGTKGIARAMADTNNVRPMQNVALGGTYSFGTQGSAAQITPSVTQTNSSDFSLQDVKTASESAIPLSILAPADSATVNTNKPTFSGTGKPGDTITITIHSSSVVTAQITVGPDGKWSYTPNQALDPGQHTVTIASATTQDTSIFSVLGVSTSTPTKTATNSASSQTPVAGTTTFLWAGTISGLLILLIGVVFALL